MTTNIENWKTIEVDAFLDPEDATNVLEGAVDTIRERCREMAAARRASGGLQPLLYGGEQLTIAVDNCEQLWMGDHSVAKRNAEAVETIGRMGRSARVQVELRTKHVTYLKGMELPTLNTFGTVAIRDLYESALQSADEGRVPVITLTVTG